MADVDLVLRGGDVHDGSGTRPWVGDVAIAAGRIVELGPELGVVGHCELDVRGLVVAPGFINMMSWAGETLIEDGRSASDVRQGITLEVMGEGSSMGPLSGPMKEELAAHGLTGVAGGYRYSVEWTTLVQYLQWLEHRGVAPNIASFVGAGTLRLHEVGHDCRAATAVELTRMCQLLEQEMHGGALGVASALIYPPETAYTTEELAALATVAGRNGGMYASHIRSESVGLLDALTELIEIARTSNVRAEVYHLKAAGRENWRLLPEAIAMVEAARDEGLAITGDVYPYDCSGTSLATCIPPWAHDGGPEAMRRRLALPDVRNRIRAELGTSGWENPFLDAGPDRIVVLGPMLPESAELQGLTLAEIAGRAGRHPADVAMDLVQDNPGEVFALFFDMSLDGVRQVARQPWVSFCTDAESLSVETARQRGGVHPRAFGSFPRVLGRLVREEGLMSLPEAIRRMTSLPADNLGLRDRGRLQVGHHADVVVLDPVAVADHATPSDPARYASGVVHVLVNGSPVLLDGTHTGALPGRFVRGPGYRRAR